MYAVVKPYIYLLITGFKCLRNVDSVCTESHTHF